VSPPLAREIRVANGHIACIGNGVDPDELERRAAAAPPVSVPEDQPLIVYAGRLDAEKGLFDLLEAYAPLRDHARLVLIGDGPLARALQAEVRLLGLADTVVFTGHVDNPLPLIKRAAMLVLPSYTEGTPLVILEAMALGTPVIAAAVGGIPDLITDRHSGLLVPPRRPDLLQDLIENLLGHADLRDRLRQNARQRVQESFTQAAVARRFESHVLGWLGLPPAAAPAAPA
jgi:glycosyltransferase involved in cell wall biosynthesis